jgi:hypothetical protein
MCKHLLHYRAVPVKGKLVFCNKISNQTYFSITYQVYWLYTFPNYFKRLSGCLLTFFWSFCAISLSFLETSATVTRLWVAKVWQACIDLVNMAVSTRVLALQLLNFSSVQLYSKGVCLSPLHFNLFGMEVCTVAVDIEKSRKKRRPSWRPANNASTSLREVLDSILILILFDSMVPIDIKADVLKVLQKTWLIIVYRHMFIKYHRWCHI